MDPAPITPSSSVTLHPISEENVNQVIDYVRSLPNAEEMFLSYVPGDHGERPFYARLGFVDTGVEKHGELEKRLEL